MSGISRRDVLRNLTVGALGGSVMNIIPIEAAELAHQMVHQEKSTTPTGKYTPKFFPAEEYQTLTVLCDMIIPKDAKSAGAIEAGAPEFIDLLSSENEEYQLLLGGGLMWLDNFCVDRYSQTFLQCQPSQRKEALDLIAFQKKCQDRPIAQPRRPLLWSFTAHDHRRLLHQQNWHRRFAIHRQHRPCRIPRLPAISPRVREFR